MSNIDSQISPEFMKVMKDFIKDLSVTFPDKITKEACSHLLMLNEENLDQTDQWNVLYEYCKKIYPQLFFDILYEKNELFEKSIELLPGIDFC